MNFDMRVFKIHYNESIVYCSFSHTNGNDQLWTVNLPRHAVELTITTDKSGAPIWQINGQTTMLSLALGNAIEQSQLT